MRRTLALLPALLHCATGAVPGGPSNEDGGESSGDDAAASFGDSPSPSPSGCSEAAKLVYVVSHENDLYSFSPPTLAFSKIGRLQCPAGGAMPMSMAVDRSGVAWVHYDSGSLFRVSTSDASCAPTSFASDQSGFHNFGMGFSSEGPSSVAETLYASDYGGQGLARIDLSTFVLAPIGPFTGPLAGMPSELTGTGDGRLFGFFAVQPAVIARVQKSNGTIVSSQPLGGVDTGAGWAFAFWGGDFWLFTTSGSTSEVTQYTPSSGSIALRQTNIGFIVVGAGVSTCAPFAPPN